MGVGVSMVYGVSRKALAYPKEVPSDYTGSPLDLDTEQLTITQKASTPSYLLLFFTHIIVDPMAFHPAPPIDPRSGQSQLPFLLYADICGEQEELHKRPAYRTHRFCRSVECGLLFRDLV